MATKVGEAMMVDTSTQPTEPGIPLKDHTNRLRRVFECIYQQSHYQARVILGQGEGDSGAFPSKSLHKAHSDYETEAPDPLTAATEQLSKILGGEAQRYWNNILTVAHMVQFHAAYGAVLKGRVEEAKGG